MLFDFDDTSNQNIYKLLVATIGPRPIAWVTTQDVDGTVNAAPFSFFNAMSGNPPVVAFGIGGRGPGDVKDTGGNIRRTGEFVVNLVSFALAEQMNITAIDFPKEIDELAEAGLTKAPSTKVKPPRILEAPVSMECERLVIVDVGIDRAVVLGKVLAIHVQDDC
ncbi:MAG: flavin reductase family protein, partial [Rhodospirillales bacterium]|nr:flavin reductase family protein [Rhodospirillales bacterium]